MIDTDSSWRRTLARALTRTSNASTAEILASPPALSGKAHRVGITGPPGVGKSSLIAALAGARLAKAERVGVLAIDPTSPNSGGSLLGDRVRMDQVADRSGLFIRSVPSGTYTDGLCPNVLGLLACFDQADFDEVILETVGVGQINYVGRHLVDTFILVLAPESGDTVQAMKAGILETADIYVVNKADLGTAQRLVSELKSIAGWRSDASRPATPVLLVSAHDPDSCSELDGAIDQHRAMDGGRKSMRIRERRAYQLESLLRQRLEEVGSANMADLQHMQLEQAYELFLEKLSAA